MGDKRVLVLGAGMVARPLVRYLLKVPGVFVRVADQYLQQATATIPPGAKGEPMALDVTDATSLDRAVSDADVVVSLLPYTLHVDVARRCLERHVSLVTTSYASPAMRALDGTARAAGVILLNEMGLDPGIDHMSAMRIINGVRRGGGRVVSFRSYCGGLPSAGANTNPWGYKFSWSPRGVVLAARNAARYLEDGREVSVPPESLFEDIREITVPGAGTFERYPNRDSLPYIQIYGLENVETMFRGTLRNAGWCRTWSALSRSGFLSLEEDDYDGLDYEGFAARVLGASAGTARNEMFNRIGDGAGVIVAKLDWLGLFGKDAVAPRESSPLDVLAALLLRKCGYAPGEKDMIVLYHDVEAAFGDQRKRIMSSLIVTGESGGDSAMARTVGLPAAAATRFILEGRLTLTGVHIPTLPEIYEPVLMELERLGISCEERAYAA